MKRLERTFYIAAAALLFISGALHAQAIPVEVVEDTAVGLVVRFSASDPLVIARLLLRLGPAADLLEGATVDETLSDLRSRIVARCPIRRASVRRPAD